MLITESRLTASKIPYKLVGAASLVLVIHRRIKQILSEIHGLVDSEEKKRISGVRKAKSNNTQTSGGGSSTQINHVKGSGEQHITGNSGANKNQNTAYMPDHETNVKKTKSGRTT